MIKEYFINNFNEYLVKIKELKDENKGYRIWFRGQSNSDWRLEPGIFREVYSITNKKGEKFDSPIKTNLFSNNGDSVRMPNMWRILDDFERIAKDNIIQYSNKIQLLEIAQHYGLPTLLLDWTTDPLVALYFAIDNINLKSIDTLDEKFATIWVINPIKINQITFNEPNCCKLLNSIENVDKILQETKMPIGTFCFEGTKSHPRICRQSGNFTFTCSAVTYTLDFTEVYQDSIYKIIIPYSIVDELKEILELCDLSYETIYYENSELDEISAKVKGEFYKKFHEQLGNLFI